MRFILILLFLFPHQVKSQNLLPNGDFEEQIICEEFGVPCGPMGWKLTTPEPPRYMTKYIEKKDMDGNQEKAYVAKWPSILVKGYPNQNDREYMQAPILCPLEKGKKYIFRMDVRPEEAAIKDIGVLFVHNFIYTRNNHILYLPPQIKFHFDNYLKGGKDQWITLTTSYIANGTEQYILIGNFLDDKQTFIRSKRTFRNSLKTYYDIDNVSLTLKETENVCDYSKYLEAIRADRHRHTAYLPRLFPIIPMDSIIAYQDSTTIFLGTDTVRAGKPFILKNIYFDVDKYDLLPKSFEELGKLVLMLYERPLLTIEIRGHTDITGTEAHNWELSVNRAKSVVDYLISKGINQIRLSYHGFASTLPISTNDTPEGRQDNRRVEFVVKE